MEFSFSENLLSYIWQFQLFQKDNLVTKSGKQIRIVKQGTPQYNQGPDFSQAKIAIDDITLAGSVEIHKSTKDWYLHQHQTNKQYNTVILHVVWNANESFTKLENGEHVEVLALQNLVKEELLARYDLLMKSSNKIACDGFDITLNELERNNYLQKLAIGRIQRKVEEIEKLIENHQGNWNQIVFIQLARYLGTSLNNVALQSLSESIDIRILLKSKSAIKIIEAILFGQAGMLDSDKTDDYFIQLKKEYNYQKRLHSLSQISSVNFHYSKIRPSAFPSFRIAQLASLMFHNSFLIEDICSLNSIDEIKKLFQIAPHPYWNEHYDFDQAQKKKHSLQLGKNSIEMLAINFICPLMFAYGKHRGDEDLCDKSVALLEKIAAEKNSITRLFEAKKIKAYNALESQALIELKNVYCDYKKCLNCMIGHKLLNS
jgi:hypothetical protein